MKNIFKTTGLLWGCTLLLVAMAGLLYPLPDYLGLPALALTGSLLTGAVYFYVRSTFLEGLQQIEHYLQEIVEGLQPDIPLMPAPWLLIGKRIKAITTYLYVMRQSMEDRITLLEEEKERVEQQKQELQDSYMALVSANEIQEELRGIMEVDAILNAAMRIMIGSLAAQKGYFLQVEDRGDSARVVSTFNSLLQLGQRVSLEEPLQLLRAAQRSGGDELNSYALDTAGTLFGDPFSSCMLAPLHVEGELWGLICLLDRESRDKNKVGSFSEKDRLFLRNMASSLEKDVKNAHLFELATTDALSRLYMRRYFEQRAEEEIRRSARYQHPFCFLVADIDHFKRFNDSYGHLVGDEVIQLVAACLKQSVRSGVDLVGRYGGEEMVLLLPMTGLNAGLHVAERIRESVAELQVPSLQHLPEPPSITISIGVAVFPGHGQTLRTLIEFADQGLYQAKEAGRNRVEVFAKPA